MRPEAGINSKPKNRKVGVSHSPGDTSRNHVDPGPGQKAPLSEVGSKPKGKWQVEGDLRESRGSP